MLQITFFQDFSNFLQEILESDEVNFYRYYSEFHKYASLLKSQQYMIPVALFWRYMNLVKKITMLFLVNDNSYILCHFKELIELLQEIEEQYDFDYEKYRVL